MVAQGAGSALPHPTLLPPSLCLLGLEGFATLHPLGVEATGHMSLCHVVPCHTHALVAIVLLSAFPRALALPCQGGLEVVGAALGVLGAECLVVSCFYCKGAFAGVAGGGC